MGGFPGVGGGGAHLYNRTDDAVMMRQMMQNMKQSRDARPDGWRTQFACLTEPSGTRG